METNPIRSYSSNTLRAHMTDEQRNQLDQTMSRATRHLAPMKTNQLLRLIPLERADEAQEQAERWAVAIFKEQHEVGSDTYKELEEASNAATFIAYLLKRGFTVSL